MRSVRMLGRLGVTVPGTRLVILCDGFSTEVVPNLLPPARSKAQQRVRLLGQGIFGARCRIATCSAVLLAGMFGYHVVFGHNGLIAYRAKRDQMRGLQQQMIELQGENTRLRSHVDRLSGDPNAIEHEAREALHYTRPGEVIYTMPVDSSR